MPNHAAPLWWRAVDVVDYSADRKNVGGDDMAVIPVTKRFVRDRFLPFRERWPRLLLAVIIAGSFSQLVAAVHPLDDMCWSSGVHHRRNDDFLRESLAAGLAATTDKRHVRARLTVSPCAHFHAQWADVGTAESIEQKTCTLNAGFPFRSATWSSSAAWIDMRPESWQGNWYSSERLIAAEEGRLVPEDHDLTSLSDACPIRPLWLGLLGNVAVYVLTFNIAVFILADARRSLRERRGQCGRCGHHRAATGPCVECGDIPDHPIIPDLI